MVAKKKTPKKAQKVCVGVNAFLRALDVKLATTFVSDMRCSDYKKLVSKTAKKYPQYASTKSLKSAQKLLLKGVMCNGKIVTNVAAMRRKIARISCN